MNMIDSIPRQMSFGGLMCSSLEISTFIVVEVIWSSSMDWADISSNTAKLHKEKGILYHFENKNKVFTNDKLH